VHTLVQHMTTIRTVHGHHHHLAASPSALCGHTGAATPACCLHACQAAHLHKLNRVWRQQLCERRRHLPGLCCAVDELIQQRLEDKALPLVNQRHLQGLQVNVVFSVVTRLLTTSSHIISRANRQGTVGASYAICCGTWCCIRMHTCSNGAQGYYAVCPCIEPQPFLWALAPQACDALVMQLLHLPWASFPWATSAAPV
jgi:hypothetical protein